MTFSEYLCNYLDLFQTVKYLVLSTNSQLTVRLSFVIVKTFYEGSFGKKGFIYCSRS